MSITYGFYNAVNVNGVWDREYTAEQLSSIFDGLVNDGVYQSIGNRFAVTATNPASELMVTIGTGRAWFEHTWILNDAPINITFASRDASLDRIDAVVIKIDSTNRVNSITVKQGALSASPVKPTLDAHTYPLAYVKIRHGDSTITQARIENAVGTSACPYVTGLVQIYSIDQLVAQWQAQWNEWLSVNENIVQTRIDYLDTEIYQVEQEVGADLKPIVGYDISVAKASFNTYTPSGTDETNIYNDGYTYRALIPLANVLPGMRPYVTFDIHQLVYAEADILNQFQCTTDGVYAYASARPAHSVKVLTLECRKTVT